MATGDLGNNLRILERQIKSIKYNGPLDAYGLSKGDPSAILPLIHYCFLDFSTSVAGHLTLKYHITTSGKDAKFIDHVYRILRDEFSYKPSISREQFFTVGFAERKILLMHDVIRLLKQLDSNIYRHIPAKKQKHSEKKSLNSQTVSQLKVNREQFSPEAAVIKNTSKGPLSNLRDSFHHVYLKSDSPGNSETSPLRRSVDNKRAVARPLFQKNDIIETESIHNNPPSPSTQLGNKKSNRAFPVDQELEDAIYDDSVIHEIMNAPKPNVRPDEPSIYDISKFNESFEYNGPQDYLPTKCKNVTSLDKGSRSIKSGSTSPIKLYKSSEEPWAPMPDAGSPERNTLLESSCSVLKISSTTEKALDANPACSKCAGSLAIVEELSRRVTTLESNMKKVMAAFEDATIPPPSNLSNGSPSSLPDNAREVETTVKSPLKQDEPTVERFIVETPLQSESSSSIIRSASLRNEGKTASMRQSVSGKAVDNLDRIIQMTREKLLL